MGFSCCGNRCHKIYGTLRSGICFQKLVTQNLLLDSAPKQGLSFSQIKSWYQGVAPERYHDVVLCNVDRALLAYSVRPIAIRRQLHHWTCTWNMLSQLRWTLQTSSGRRYSCACTPAAALKTARHFSIDVSHGCMTAPKGKTASSVQRTRTPGHHASKHKAMDTDTSITILLYRTLTWYAPVPTGW